jgi:hypothetical protein
MYSNILEFPKQPIVNTQDDTITLETSSFEESWFKQEIETNQLLRNKVIDTVLAIQQVCSRQWTNQARVVLKGYNSATYSLDIYVFFQGGYRSYIKHTIIFHL